MYHDREWGIPTADDRSLFEKICLEAFQCGLSWSIVLARRDRLREVFANFEIAELVRFTSDDIDRIVGDPTIIRHRGKVSAVVTNARACTTLVEEVGSLGVHIWSYAPRNESASTAPTLRSSSDESKSLSKDLKRRGWSFVGPTTVYSMMQAVGMVNDHDPSCPVREHIDRAKRTFEGVLAGKEMWKGRKTLT